MTDPGLATDSFYHVWFLKKSRCALDRRRGPMTLSQTTDPDLACVFAKKNMPIPDWEKPRERDWVSDLTCSVGGPTAFWRFCLARNQELHEVLLFLCFRWPTTSFLSFYTLCYFLSKSWFGISGHCKSSEKTDFENAFTWRKFGSFRCRMRAGDCRLCPEQTYNHGA